MSNRLQRSAAVCGVIAVPLLVFGMSTVCRVALADDAKASDAHVGVVDPSLAKLKDLLKDERKMPPLMKDTGMKAAIDKEVSIDSMMTDSHLVTMISERIADPKIGANLRDTAADEKILAAAMESATRSDDTLRALIQDLMARRMVALSKAGPKEANKSSLKGMQGSMLARETLPAAMQGDGAKTAVAREAVIQQMMKDPELMKMVEGRLSDPKVASTMKGMAANPKEIKSKDAMMKMVQEMVARKMLTDAAVSNAK